MKNNQTTSSSQKELWNQFVVQNNGSFLQSYQWGEFQESLGRKIWRLDGEEWQALAIKHNLPLGKNYLYCPRGPVVERTADSEQRTKLTISGFLKEIKKIAGQEKSIFFKIEPDIDLKFSDFGLAESPRQIQPLKTLILDISKSEEKILDQMHPKTRYNIRLAQRKGIKVKIASEINADESKIFLNLLEETAKRDKFYLHSQEYYQKMLEVLGREGMVKLFLAQYQDRIITANLVIFFGQTAVYLHGASDYSFRNLMAPYLVQWQTILEAKKMLSNKVKIIGAVLNGAEIKKDSYYYYHYYHSSPEKET